MKDYTKTIEKLRELQIGYSGTGMGRILKEGSDAIEELIEEVKRLTEENKELCDRMDYCTRTATAPFMVTTSDEVKSLGPYGPTNTRGSINVNK